MRLGLKQELFGRLYAEHLVWLTEQGYQYRLGDVFAHDGHRDGSMHYLKLAGDINLFRDGEFLTRTLDHKFSGHEWKTRHPLCRWGGDFGDESGRGQDGNHYSLTHNGRA